MSARRFFFCNAIKRTYIVYLIIFLKVGCNYRTKLRVRRRKKTPFSFMCMCVCTFPFANMFFRREEKRRVCVCLKMPQFHCHMFAKIKISSLFLNVIIVYKLHGVRWRWKNVAWCKIDGVKLTVTTVFKFFYFFF